MPSKHTRLDRFISKHAGINRRDVRLILAQGRIVVDGLVATDINQVIGEFNHVTLDDQCLQKRIPVYLMVNKPQGVVSATIDDRHKTIIDLLDLPDKNDLHIVGRLDFNSTGLVLLTNDGRWSRHLTSPSNNVIKRYRVTLENPINNDYVEAFAKGMYFPFEDITTRPASLIIINNFEAEVGLVEGRYHQIKRMFGRFQNPVIKLHRIAIGSLELDDNLAIGQSRTLTTAELRHITKGEH